jgi:hypothetical protein
MLLLLFFFMLWGEMMSLNYSHQQAYVDPWRAMVE